MSKGKEVSGIDKCLVEQCQLLLKLKVTDLIPN